MLLSSCASCGALFATDPFPCTLGKHVKRFPLPPFSFVSLGEQKDPGLEQRGGRGRTISRGGAENRKEFEENGGGGTDGGRD